MVSAPLMVMLRFALTDWFGLLESVTLTVKLNVPCAVGVPEIWPVARVSVKPVGRLPPVMLHEYGWIPPDAVSAALYGELIRPVGRPLVVICSGRLLLIE